MMNHCSSSNPIQTAPLSLTWQWAGFFELSGYQLYHIIQAREQVFVKDQKAVYVDADGIDIDAMHLAAYQDDNSGSTTKPLLVAYCRLLTSTTEPRHPIIGRVLVVADYRGHGLARELMLNAIEYCQSHFPDQPIHLSAQTYLIRFYESLGFVCEGATYHANGIEHIHMILAAHK